MESKYKFEVLSKERHSVRKFLPKEVPEKVLTNYIQKNTSFY